MKPEIEKKDDLIVIKLFGEYSYDTYPTLIDLYESEDLGKIKCIIVDCEKLDSIDNTSTELFDLRAKLFKQGGRFFIFCGLSKNLERMFNNVADSFNFEPVFNLPSLQDAFEHLKHNH